MAQKPSYAESVRNAPSSSSFTVSEQDSKLPTPPKPVVNVWNVRLEKLAATRAAQKNPPQDAKSSPPDIDRDDPFVVRLPHHLVSQPSTPVVAAPQPTDNNTRQDNWPQVGEAISISTSSSDSSITDDAAKNVNGTTISRKKNIGEKKKWVSIPKQELQAAADAASASSPKRNRRSQPPTTITDNSSANSTKASTSASTSSLSLSQSRTSSGHPSASHSRAESLHSSPKVARHGKKLPPESENQLPISGLDGVGATSANRGLPANSTSSPKQDDSHRSEGGIDNSRINKVSSARNQRASASQPQSQPPPKSQKPAYSAVSSDLMQSLPNVQLQPFHPTIPVFFPQHPQLNHYHTTSKASDPSSHIQELNLPSSSSTSAQSLPPHLQHPPFPHPHAHGQPAYPHAPYPLYNLTMPPMNSYDYAPPDIAPRSPHYPPYPAPPNLTTPPHYAQVDPGSLSNDSGPIDRNRASPAETLSTAKSNNDPSAREKMVFGSIDVSSNPDNVKASKTLEEERKEDEKEKEKKKPFAIGVENGHDLPGRSRPIQKKTGGRAVKEKSEKKDEKDKRKVREEKEDDSTVSAPAIAPKMPVEEPRWTFGTTSVPSPYPSSSRGTPSPSISSQVAANIDNPSTEDASIKPSFTQPVSGATTPFVLEPQASSSYIAPSSNIPPPPSIPIHQTPHHPYHVHLHQMHSPSAHGSAIPLPPPLSIPVQMPPSIPTTSSTSDPDLEVKDYGWGFGDASGLGYAPIIVKERAREWEAERARERAAAEAGDIQALGFNNEDGVTSPMAENETREAADKDNSIHDQGLSREHMHPREYHLGRGRRGILNGRGGYGDRGAGGYRRPRGSMNGFLRGFGRGGHYGNHYNRGGGISPVNSRGPSSPFNATPPHHFQALPIDSSGALSPLPLPPLGGYYHPHPHHPNPGRPYIPPGYEAFNPSPTIAGVPPPLPVDSAGIALGQSQTHQAHLPLAHQGQMLPSGKHLTRPVPVPKTTISFPLDSTRYYLLGQLEYYLSAENMAQDFYLRQRMDARGWIPISLIASFNRVRQLTQDVQLVKDVLYLSSLVQVRGNMVRMGGWEPFVLPDAAPSTVEDQPLPYPYQNLTNYYYSEDPNARMSVEAVNGELGAVGYPELLHATSGHHHHHSGEAGEGRGRDFYSGGPAITVNGRAQELDEDDEDEVEIVMGQGVGTVMYDRRTAPS